MTQNEKKTVCVILGTAHGNDVLGKCSPDKSFYEWKFSRMMCSRIMKRLQDDGYRCITDYEGLNEIGLVNRCQIVNNYCGYFGKSNCVYVSIHVNAAGSDSKWHKATGWESHVAKTASANSIKLANIMWEEAEKQGKMKLRRPMPKQNYWCNNFTVLTLTKCPAVLTENCFQDNKDDVAFLNSKEGQQCIEDLHVNAIERYVNELITK